MHLIYKPTNVLTSSKCKSGVELNEDDTSVLLPIYKSTWNLYIFLAQTF